jgi:predicted anti-sigma-YlaC factor YlaD
MTCAEVRAALGADALGALEEAESAAVREHLATCAECRAVQRELAGAAGVLALVSREEVEQAFSDSEHRLARLLERVRSERIRERRLRWRTGLVAAVLLAAAVGGGGWAVGRWLTPSVPGGGAPVAYPTPTAAPVTWTAVDPSTSVEATVTMNTVAWGTKIDVALTGVRKGDVCSLVIYDRAGRRWGGGSWKVAYDRGVRWSGGVAVSADQVTRIEILAADDGGPLISLER